MYNYQSVQTAISLEPEKPWSLQSLLVLQSTTLWSTLNIYHHHTIIIETSMIIHRLSLHKLCFLLVQEVWHVPKHVFKCVQCWKKHITARVHISHMEIFFSFLFFPSLTLFDFIYLFICFPPSILLSLMKDINCMWFMGYIEGPFKVMECLSKPYVSWTPLYSPTPHFIYSKLAF